MTANAALHSHTTHEWLQPTARAGYAARGFVYLLVGGLALAAAFYGGTPEGSEGALSRLTDHSLGQIVLGLVALGLVGYAIWRFFQAAFDADGHGTDAKGIAVRGGLFVSSLTHLALALYAVSLLVGLTGGEENNTQSAIAWLMSKPAGQWLVGIVGLCILGAGFAQLLKAVKERFMRYLEIPPQHRNWAIPISKAGIIARAVVFLIIGGFVMLAAYKLDPSEAKGLEGALETLQDQAYGPWLLGLLAIGLLGFAVYSFLQSAYRRIPM